MRRKVSLAALVFFISLVTVQNARAITLNEIDFFIGSGANQAAFVLDWNDGRDSLIWGYQWDGVATADDMFHAIVAADPRLFAKVAQFDFGGTLFEFIVGIGYDRDDDGFALSDGTFFTDGFFDGPPSDGATATDLDDSYVEGFNTGFWAFYVADGNPYVGDTWDESQVGTNDTILVDGGFVGFRFAPGFVATAPTQEPVAATAPSSSQNGAVPEPASLLMLGMGALALVVRRRAVIE